MTILIHIENIDRFAERIYIDIFESANICRVYTDIEKSFVNLKQLFAYHDRSERRKGEQDEEKNRVQCRHVAKKRAPVSTRDISQQ